MNYAISQVVDKINDNVQNGYEAVNEAAKQITSSENQKAGKKKFRLTKKSRMVKNVK
jgi:hypothetical protein